MSISENQRKCLAVLAEAYNNDACYLFFRTVAKRTGLPERKVRIYIRALARKGLAEYDRVFDDDLRVAGSGYACTPKGRDLIHAE